jgi:shikimate kinase
MSRDSAGGPTAVLIGSPGAGKSSVGRRVAKRLGVRFVDSDRLIERTAGMSVADIFVSQGEDAFRAMEEEAVAAALAEPGGVLSLGGGAVMREATRQRLRDHRVIWLKVSLGDAASRVGLNTARPLLLGNVRGTLKALMDERAPMYEEVATAVVDTSDRTIGQVVDEVVEVIGRG